MIGACNNVKHRLTTNRQDGFDTMHSNMKKYKSFTHWSVVFTCATVLWLIFEQNRKMLTGEATGVVFWPILGAMCIMVHYERKIRSLAHSNPPEITVGGRDEEIHSS